ncbi:nitrilase-related carbon-nitrogen hydrolase [Chthonobacter rhizosphaerae]|uniref:nitrilase-related carbon-nitrogen hydrolase n=1 Tax=Chthonobacter rhizosphaerae TaxID=2735553 RepID=UPI0015EEDB70|nr:nitrilase-related carbon-nitrogen hydrolase [Chthonobacter rhizosphaerae]
MTSAPARLRLALAQIRLGGSPRHVAARLRHVRAEAAEAGADLVVTPALALTGGRTDPATVAEARAALDGLAAETADGGPALLVGTALVDGGRLHDAAVLLDRGRIEGLRFRVRVDAPYAAGPMPGPLAVRGVRVGIVVGSDLDGEDVAECLAETGAELVVVLGAWTFGPDAAETSLQTAVARVVETDLPLVAVNGVGGLPDGRLLAGASFGLEADRGLACQLPLLAEAAPRLDLHRADDDRWVASGGPVADLPGPEEALWRALGAAGDHVLRLSGASAVAVDATDGAAGLAIQALADALGPDRVLALVPDDRPVLPPGLDARVRRVPLALAPLVAALGHAVGAPADAADAALEAIARVALLDAAAVSAGAVRIAASPHGPGAADAYDLCLDLDAADLDRLAAWLAAAGSPPPPPDEPARKNAGGSAGHRRSLGAGPGLRLAGRSP